MSHFRKNHNIDGWPISYGNVALSKDEVIDILNMLRKQAISTTLVDMELYIIHLSKLERGVEISFDDWLSGRP